MFGKRFKILGALSKLRNELFGSIVSVDSLNKEVALTFDDGPHPEFTPRLLEVLLRYDAKATFFMLGIMAEKYPNVVKLVMEGGHEIGNHSWDHPSLLTIPIQKIKAQLTQTKRLLAPFGQSLMRPPFGHQSLRTYISAKLLGYQVVAWNLVAEDWLDKNANCLADNLMKKIKPGSIILLHDSLYHAFEDQYRDRKATIGAVEILLKNLPEYKFVKVSELLKNGLPVKEYWSNPIPDDFLSNLKVKKLYY